MRSSALRSQASLLVRALLVASICLLWASAALATTYYVDSVGGNDNYSGTSPSAAWQTLTKVNATTFQPGDQILFKAGCTWTGQLWPKGSGASGSPIVIDMYSTGAKPSINGAGVQQKQTAVLLYNQQYWEIKNLAVTNTSGTVAQRFGVYIQGENAGQLNHIHLLNLDVHDVSGDPTIPHCGGIFLEVLSPTTVSTWFNDVLIEGCTIHNLDSSGIITWSGHSRYSDINNWVPTTNLVIRNTVVHDVSCDGIRVCHANAPLVEYNVVHHAAYGNLRCGIWNYDTDNAVFQFNEAYACGDTSGADGNGFDIDGLTRWTIMQYNYSHECPGGSILICDDNGAVRNTESVVRYHISQNDEAHPRNMRFVGDCRDPMLYNNTYYTPVGQAQQLIYIKNWNGAAKNVRFWNNIFQHNGTGYWISVEKPGKGYYVADYNLCYAPNGTVGSPFVDPHIIYADPLFVNPGSGGIGIGTVSGYQIQSGSPARDSGMTVPNNGGLDYWGNPVPSGSATDRGAHEYQGGGGQPPVANFTGNPTSGPAPLTVMFTDTSTNSPTSWSWNFGDGGTSTAQNPSHQYAAGTYTVSLRATNAYGFDDEVKTNYITATSGGQPPVAQFVGVPTSGTAPLTVNFTDQSTNTPTSWSWNFGDSGTSTAQNPSHQYAAGTYTVSLRATNAYGFDDEVKTNYITATSGGNSCHVGSIFLRPLVPPYKVMADIYVHDQNCANLAGVTVDVTWSGCVSGTSSGVTDGNGEVSLQSPRNTTGGGLFTCCVTNLTKTGYSYNSSANHETCDSLQNP